MQLLLYATVGVLLYLASDWLLRRIESRRGARFEQRTLVFFAIMLLLTLSTFAAIEWWLGRAA